MRLSGTKTGSANQYNGLGDQLYDLGGARPTLDLNFASNGSLVDSVTGKTLVTHTRASNATYVDGDGIIRDAVTNLLLRSEEFDNASWSTLFSASLTANQVEAPNGTLTADQLTISNSNAYSGIRQNYTFLASTTYTFSCWVRAVSGTASFRLKIYDGVADTFSSNQSATETWQRFTLTMTTASGAAAGNLAIANIVSPLNQQEIYLWGAQLEQSSTAGEYVKTTSTINSAPRFDHKVTRTTTNLLIYSEEFDRWVQDNTTITVDSSVELAPDGTATADKIVETAVTAFHYITNPTPNPTVANGESITGSFFAKAGERYSLSAYLVSGGILSTTQFNLSTGTVESGPGSMTDVGNGWYRCSLSATAGDSSARLRILLTGNSSYAGDGTSGLYLWGAQLEQNSDVGPYVKTTGAAATKVDAEPLGLLVEESRTNNIDDSSFQDFGSSVTNNQWFEVSSSFDVTSNQAVSPDGGTNASSFYINTATSYQAVQYRTGLATGTDYAFSVFAKAGAVSDDVTLFLGGDITTNYIRAIFTLTGDGSYSGSTSNGTAVVASAPTIQAVGNGWYRCTIYATFTSPTNITSLIYPGLFNSQAEGTTTYLWGAQLEAGSFPTSYIRTAGSIEQRAADVTSIEGNDFGTFNLLQYSEEFDNSYWTKTRSSISANQATAPNGTYTADLIVEDTTAATSHLVYRGSNPAPVSNIYTWSGYFKTAGRDVALRMDATGLHRAHFDLTNGTIIAVSGGITAQIESVGNSWYRCSITLNTASNVTNAVYELSDNGSVTFDGDGVSGVYVWGAQLEESSTATPYVKSDVTWTSRASNATYYDYTGTLRKSSYNELWRSEEFDNAIWKINAVTLTADAIESPDGTLTAEKVEGVNTTSSYLYQQFVSALTNTTYTFSFWIKSVDGSSGTWGVNHYNGSVHNRTTVPVTGEWNRVSVQFSNFSAVSNNIYIADNRSGLADLTEAYIWGAQLEKGPYAGDYAKTEGSAASTARNAAFLPDGSGNFVSAGELLLEDAGTNLLPDSETIGGTGWYTLGSGDSTAVATVNAAIAPNGTQTASRIDFNRSSTSQYRLFRPDNAVSATGLTQGSVFVKAATASDVGKVIDLWQFTGGVRNQSTATLTNEWQRVSLVNTYSHTGSIAEALSIGFINSGGGGELSVSVLVWGAQLEANPYPTSYIPTYGSTATRAADVSSSSSNTFGNSFYNQTEGTVFASAVISGASNETGITGLTNAGETDFLRVSRLQTTSRLRSLVFDDSVAQTDTQPTNTISIGQAFKLATVLKQNDFSTVLDGGSAAVDTSGTMPTVNRMTIGTGAFLTQLNGTLSRLTVWPTRLSNDTLQTITV